VSLVVVLVGTQDVVNIAGVVRAMKNFELRDLRLVQPEEYEPIVLTLSPAEQEIIHQLEDHRCPTCGVPLERREVL